MGEVADFARDDRPVTAQPPPTAGRGTPIYLLAMAECWSRRYFVLRRLIRDRAAFGRRKYDRDLRAHNGRDPIRDTIEELADGVMYLIQAEEEGHPRARLYLEAVLAVVGRMAEDELPMYR